MPSSAGTMSEKTELMEILDSLKSKKSQSSESNQQHVKEELMMPVEAYNFYKTNY